MSAARMCFLAIGIASLITATLTSSSRAWELGECTRISPRSAAELQKLGKTCMSEGERAVGVERLEADGYVIATTYKTLVASNDRTGVKDERILEKFATAWASRRWQDQTMPLSSEVFMGGAGYGRLTVESEPIGASVDVNNERWKDPTDTTEWTPEGDKEIVLKKDRCNDEKGHVTVGAGKPVKFKRKLRCKT